MRAVVPVWLLIGGLVATAALNSPVLASDRVSGARMAPSPIAGSSAPVLGAASVARPGPLCSLRRSPARNVLVNCDQADSPHNETAVAVNPENTLNIIVSANDFQDYSPPPNPVRTLLSRSHVTFDGGRSWSDYRIPYPPGCTSNGDPSLAFDADGVAYLTTLCGNDGSILLTHSTDGGRSWTDQSVVTLGTPTLFNDHPTMAAWGRGNLIVTWIPFFFDSDQQTQITTVPMMTAVSHDRGAHFGPAKIVSGSAPECVGLTGAHTCDQTWGNAVTVSSRGALLATFFNTTQYAPDGSTNLGRDFHLAVRLDPSTGALSGGPYPIGQAYDGIASNDYPVDLFGRQTLQDSQFRVAMQGNIAADPTDPRHFAVVWFDDRNAPHPVSADPYAAVTNSDIIVSQSLDTGLTWSAPRAIPEPGDQFFPWAAYDSEGLLRIGYHDRRYDVMNHRYGYTLATETERGSLHFSPRQLTTTLSDPTRDQRWFVVNADARFPNSTIFLGDYSAIAATPDGVIAAWTDERVTSCQFGPCGHGQDVFVAVAGPEETS